MRKKFKKRLLGIILTILMVVSVIPVQQVQPVKAAAGDMIPAGTTIYLRPNAATTWISDGAVMAFKTSANDKQSEIVIMKKMDDDLTWSGETTAEATNIDFLRLDPNDKHVWNEAGTWPGLQSGKYLYTFASSTGVTPTGMWTTYSDPGSETTSYFNVNASLVDYFNNGRVEQPDNKFYNEGDKTGPGNAPYSGLNQWLSGLKGYASNGIDDKNNDNAPVPLYFGDLLHARQAGGNLTWYWKGANVAFGSNDNETNKYVAQGIVGDHLDKNGNLITSYTNNGEPVKVPFFNEKAYDDQSNYMRFYNNLQFPFTKTTNDKGVSTYSFNSEQNTVYYDYDNNKIVRKDTLVIHDASKQKNRGYFPFNSTDPSDSNKDNLNYGFGTQFTIPFTVTGDGKNVDDTPMTFKFTGDDDVWVYIDGALVLDMGGAHEKAEGEINFETQTATIKTGTSNAKLGNQPTAGGRVASEDNEKSTVNFSDIKVKKSDNTTVTLADHMKTSGTVHELKMYYMERGMWNSNMSISYSFVPLPSGLTLSKTLDTTNVNAGLKNEVQGLDKFDFKIQTKNLKAGEKNYSDVANLGYTLYDYNDNTYPGKVAENSTATFSSSYFASEFIKTTDEDNSSAFYAGTGFKITESIPKGTKLQYDTSKTRWGVYDSVTSRAAIKTEPGTVATFDMGDASSSDMDVVNRYVNFVNTPKVGSLSVEKIYEGTAPTDKTFGFTVMVDLTGHEYYDPYKLEYTNGSQTGTTDAKGHFTLKAGEKVTFAGIPAGATYKVVEDAPGVGDTWVQDTSQCTGLTGKIAAEVPSAAVVTNKTKTTEENHVIYAEAGKTVTYAPDGVTITKLTKPTTGDQDIDTAVNTADGKGVFTPKFANKKYDVNYEGTTTDKGNFTGKITVLTYKATDKVYVFDYGLESNIADTTTGDGLFQGGIFYNEKATGTMATTAKLGEITPAQENSQTTISGSNIEIDKDGKAASAVTFKPIAFMDKAENYKYTANIAKVSTELDDTNPETGTTVNGTIKTMPANVVYYEDNFNASNNTDDSSVKIVYTNSKPTNDPTYSQSNDQSENYGHDKAYNGDLEESGNSATKMNNGDGAYFTFTGDGFDIVSRTNENTAGLIAYVYNGKKDAEYFRNPEVFKAGTKDLVKSIPVDTFYSNGDLYQVPVISTTLQQRGTYTVYLKALKTYTGQSVIYIDGVRIYNPLADKSAYLETEKNTKVQELRGMLLGSSPSINLVTPDGNNGFLIDGGSTAVEQYLPEKPEIGAYLGAETLADVMKAGPNNELYLPIDNGVAFKVSTPVGDADWTLQVGAKSVSADTSTESDAVVADKAFTVYVKPDDVKETKYQEVKNYTINTSTDMYYDINLKEVIKAQGWTADSYDVIVLNTTVDYNNYDIISLTNIKCAADMTLSKPSQLTRMGYNLAGRNVLTGNDEAVLSAKFGVTNVTRGKYASMTVVTKKEATDVQVTDPTGAVVTSFTKKTSSIDADGNKEWKLTFKVIKQRGEAKYSVDAVVNGSLTNMPYSTSIMVR